MNPILSDAGSALAVAVPGVTNMSMSKNANGIGADDAAGQGRNASSAQGGAGFGDILGQVQNLLAELVPADAQQTAQPLQTGAPMPSPQVTAASPAPTPSEGDVAALTVAESGLPAFMPVAQTVHTKAQTGVAVDGDRRDGEDTSGAPLPQPWPTAFMPNAFVAMAGFFRSAAAPTDTNAAASQVVAQGADPLGGAGAVRMEPGLAGDSRGTAAPLTVTTSTAEVAPVQADDQTTQNVVDPAGIGQLAVRLPGGNTPVATSADTLRLSNGDPTQWRQTLGEALGERIVLQREKGSDQATIRLDPPSMGQIEISIRHEAGALKVSIAATHTEVLNQLRGVGEALRQDLEQKHWGEVSVQVSQSGGTRLSGDGGQEGNGGREQTRREPGRALADSEGEAAAGFHLDDGEA